MSDLPTPPSVWRQCVVCGAHRRELSEDGTCLDPAPCYAQLRRKTEVLQEFTDAQERATERHAREFAFWYVKQQSADARAQYHRDYYTEHQASGMERAREKYRAKHGLKEKSAVCARKGCFESFKTTGRKKYCSEPCERAGRYRRKQEEKAAWRVCVWCKTAFTTAEKRRKYCSPPCCVRASGAARVQRKQSKRAAEAAQV